MNNYLSENILLPLGDVLMGSSIHSKLRFLNKSQFWTRDQLDEYQNSRLRQLIAHAYSNVPFYTSLFNDLRLKPNDIQTKEDLVKLPVITKEDLKKNKSKLLALNIPRKDLILASSSGSTGEPFQYYTTKEAESMAKAMAIRLWYWMGYRLGDKYVKISLIPRSSFIKKIQDLVNNSVFLSSHRLNTLVLNDIVESIHKNNPKFIRSYPLTLLLLSEHLKAKGQKYNGSALKAISTSGSTLYDNDRKEIENIFNVKLFDSYSCEGGSIFAQCPDHTYYHPAEEYAISEFVADNVTRFDPDKPYRHVTTDLFNFASPFIRYDSQDYVVLGDNGLCSCGRKFINVKKLKGRDGDIMRTPSGQLLIAENFASYFEWIPEVDQFQILQDKPDEVVIKLIVNASFSPTIKSKIFEHWQNYMGKDVKVSVEEVDEIKITPSGKRRVIIRNPEIKLNN